jgi:hypothetical protein
MNTELTANRIAAYVFAPIKRPEEIQQYFSHIPEGKCDKLLISNYLAFRVFIADIALYRNFGKQPFYRELSSCLFDKEIAEFWTQANREGLLAFGLDKINVVMSKYAELFKSNSLDLALRYACFEMLKESNLKPEDPIEYHRFKTEYFVPQTLKLMDFITESGKEEKSGGCGCTTWGLVAIVIFLLYVFW